MNGPPSEEMLIVSALTPSQLNDYYGEATGLGLDVLIEVHDEAELTVDDDACLAHPFVRPLEHGLAEVNHGHVEAWERLQ